VDKHNSDFDDLKYSKGKMMWISPL